jgi:hypothetical protein
VDPSKVEGGYVRNIGKIGAFLLGMLSVEAFSRIVGESFSMTLVTGLREGKLEAMDAFVVLLFLGIGTAFAVAYSFVFSGSGDDSERRQILTTIQMDVEAKVERQLGGKLPEETIGVALKRRFRGMDKSSKD